MILKTQINMRVNAHMNISQSYEHIVDGEQEAIEAGHEDGVTLNAYMVGLVRGMEASTE